MSKAYTVEEMRELFLQEVKNAVHYWATLPDQTPLERCDGLAFTMLSIFDGSHMDVPALDIIPAPHPTDKQYHKDNDENWWVPEVINDCQLHEQYCRMEK